MSKGWYDEEDLTEEEQEEKLMKIDEEQEIENIIHSLAIIE